MIIEPDRQLETGGLLRWTPQQHAQAYAAAFRTLDQLLNQTRLRDVILMVGLPAAGKSAWAMAHNSRELIILDGMYVDVASRREIVERVREASGRTSAVWVDTPLLTCLHRNAQRPADRRLPSPLIGQMFQKLLRHPPITHEGFAEVTRVKMTRAMAA